MAGNNDEVYDEKPQRYAEDNVTQWSLSNNNKRLHTSYYSVEANYTDGLKASRGLSATAELIAPNVSDTLAKASESVTECNVPVDMTGHYVEESFLFPGNRLD